MANYREKATEKTSVDLTSFVTYNVVTTKYRTLMHFEALIRLALACGTTSVVKTGGGLLVPPQKGNI